MGTGIHGGFGNTYGAKKSRELYKDDKWNTSIVWQHINVTQENYIGTDLPRSFNVDTPQGKMWTHGNATKHMHEAINSIKDDPKLKGSNPKLYTQFILFDYWKSLSKAVCKEIKYEEKVNSGSWEFIFAKPRHKGDNPVIKHAKFVGLN